MSIAVDWSYALQGRLEGPACSGVDPEQMASRLNIEVNRGELPFLDLAHWSDLEIKLREISSSLRKFKHMLLLGIGGSALGPRALQKAFFPQQEQPGHNGPWLWIADNVCAYSMEAWLDKLPPEETLVLVISKSGGTIETVGQYLLVQKWMQQKLKDAWSNHFFFITDPDKGFLRQVARENNVRTLSVPQKLGGRYSVLSAVGLVPAEFLGLDVSKLMQGARDGTGFLGSGRTDPVELSRHPGFRLACWALELMRKEYTQLIFFVYLPLWAQFGQWFAQLWAESLGKKGLGSMPLPAVGVTDQHSLQQMFLDGPKDKGCLFLTGKELPRGPFFDQDPGEQWRYLQNKSLGDLLEAEAIGTMMALHENSVPLVHLELGRDDPYHAGKLIVLLESMTLFTGWMLDINPLDQPAVELGKRLAKAKLGAPGLEQEKQKLATFKASPDQRQEL